MNVLDWNERMREAAFDYAANLRERGYQNVGVFSYSTYLNNREPHRRDHRTTFGHAVRYTSSATMDAEVWKGSDGERKGWPVPKFHDRSLTVFTGPAGMTGGDLLVQNNLTDNGGIIADFAFAQWREAVPMYTAAWSPSADMPGVRPENIPAVPSVIMKRFPLRKDGDSYPWQVGPTRMYHLIMTPAD